MQLKLSINCDGHFKHTLEITYLMTFFKLIFGINMLGVQTDPLLGNHRDIIVNNSHNLNIFNSSNFKK